MSILRNLVAPQTRAVSGITEADVLAFAQWRRGGVGSSQPIPIVSGRNSLKNPNVWSAVRLTADAMSSMSAHLFTKDADGNPVKLPTPDWILEPAFDIEMGDYLYALVQELLTAGNHVAVETGGPRKQVEAVDSGEVKIREKFREPGKTSKTLIAYWINGERVPNDKIVHTLAYPISGSRIGLSPAAHVQVQIALGILAERFGLDVYRKDGRLSGLLTSDQDLDDNDSTIISRQWEASVSSGRTPVLGKGSKFDRIQLSLEEAQSLNVQRWGAEQVARVFGVPPEILALGSTGQTVTYANRTQSMTGWYQTALSGWQRRIESRLTRWHGVPGEYVKLNPGGLLRASTKERYESYKVGIDARFLGTDEVRQWEELPPRDDLGSPPAEGEMELVTDADGNVTGFRPAKSALRAAPDIDLLSLLAAAAAANPSSSLEEATDAQATPSEAV